jgi:plastocyanin
MLRRRWWLVLAGPMLLVACSNGGSGASTALDLAPSPSITLPSTTGSTTGAAPSAAPHAAASSSPVGPTPAHSTATTKAKHSSSPRPATSRPATHSSTPSPTKKPAASYEIHTQDYYFSPANLMVPVGASVQVVDAGSSSHTWTSGSAPVHTGPFDSGNLDHGQTYTYTFHSTGSYNFFCKYHYSSGMKGHITVQ